MHAASILNSPRLRAALWAIEDAGAEGISTRDLSRQCEDYSIGTTISEIRKNGYAVTCSLERTTKNRRRVYVYRTGGRTRGRNR
jgi:hypothetical protein